MARPRIDPVTWRPERAPARARHGRGANPMPPVRLHAVPGQGPEDIAVDSAGRVYTGLTNGHLVRLPATADAGRQVGRVDADGDGDADRDAVLRPVAETGGRPLGIEVDHDDRLVVCDAVRGLLRVDPATSGVSTLVATGTQVGSAPLRLCNNAAVAEDGSIWFSDSSQRFELVHWKADLLEHSGTGRLLRWHPDGRTEEVLTGLQFANGVALAADESYVVVAETGAYRLTRVWLSGPRTGEVDRLADNLPAFPDNLARDGDGLLWIAMGSPRNALLDRVAPWHPAIRRAVWALPEALQPKPANTAWVQALDTDGRVRYDFQATVPGFATVTGVRRHGDTLWLGSLHGGVVAAFDLPATTSAADPPDPS
ncbi:SMP-30/gluconolactonase/LRE family protein [Micromonospora sp. WMMD1102]|uniref:SMP-30/gluconolactonase/LRE family protein n=1 Tax=Micromonospora sp. WMMD1102 TaxID=3016105 RepID=UPI002415090F|nr:SMP-30/gluconolactonase/LRE family protein [Micromonospora sp. WMMD1102]MDG4786647.1 SMP-30/gluconolactonase/LRE family protein [Micromonospora sp. WMMD1102]